MSRPKSPYGIRVKCKRSLSKEQIKTLESLYGSNAYGKWAIRTFSINAKYIPDAEYTISPRFFARYKTREDAQKDIMHSWERVAVIK
jgi:hypothetical protein